MGPVTFSLPLEGDTTGRKCLLPNEDQVRARVRPGAPIMVFRKLAHKPEIGTLSRESGCPGAGLKWTGKTGHLAGRLHSQDTLRIAKIIPETNRRLPQHCAWSARQGLTGIPENTQKAMS